MTVIAFVLTSLPTFAAVYVLSYSENRRIYVYARLSKHTRNRNYITEVRARHHRMECNVCGFDTGLFRTNESITIKLYLAHIFVTICKFSSKLSALIDYVRGFVIYDMEGDHVRKFTNYVTK